MRILRLLMLLSLVPGNLLAEEVMSLEEFKSYAVGKTLYFAQQGQPYGVEQYLPGQQSVWQYADGTCAKGVWFSQKQMICFIYDGEGDEQCWRFLRKGEGFAARAIGREPEADLDVIWRDDRPIACKAPDVGT